MKLEILLFGTLFDHPSTGYEIKRHFDTSARFARSNTTMSQVYRTLASMEARGWVTHTVESRAGANDAKRYALTEEGLGAFQDWIDSPYNPPSRFQDPDFAVRLSNAGHMSEEQLMRLLDTEIETRLAEVAKYRGRDRERFPRSTGLSAERLAELEEWTHRRGASEMDRHIASLMDLRARLMDGRPLIDREDVPAAEGAQR
ncbi:PadR family transcriptional regulator [Microbacterium hominis]|uniref:PadR family transcriptional regulator n=1 Tax=Microbacterium hominis TaxID=162426 RepID=A0A7D4U622_9MICO|nr:PadR family transcriptional regulator [Microbacterium hominis]QKJ20625.1 PadR family transcriptional regulator [Microbacterium hominis]